MGQIETLNRKIKELKQQQNEDFKEIFEEDLKKIDNSIKDIKTFKDFNLMLKNQDRKYTEFLITDFRPEKKKEKLEPLEKFLNIRVTKKDKELIKNLKSKKINISLEIRNFLKSLDSEKFYELHLEKIKLKKIELKKIEEEIRNKIKKLSEILFKKFNLENAEERYIIRFEIKDLQIKKDRIENYLEQFK